MIIIFIVVMTIVTVAEIRARNSCLVTLAIVLLAVRLLAVAAFEVSALLIGTTH